VNRILRKGLRALFGHDPHYFDMYLDPEEALLAQRYLQAMTPHLAAVKTGNPLALLDAGCQAGRLAIPLAERGHRLIGVDTSGFALRRARQHSQRARVKIRWIKGDILRVLPKFPPGSFDGILCIEVLYLRQNFLEILEAFRGALRQGGILMTSHRPLTHYLKAARERQDPETARFIETHREGELWGSYFNWQTASELPELYRQVGFSVREIRPIERCTEEPHYLLVVAQKARITADQNADFRGYPLQSAQNPRSSAL